MKIKTLIFIVPVSLLVFYTSCSQAPPSISPEPSTAALVPDTRNLVNGVISIGAGEYYNIKFSVATGTMLNARVTGTFKAEGGTGNDIEVLIVDDTSFGKWTNGHKVPELYYSGKVNSANISVAIANSGVYHLIFDNSFSLISSKQVLANVDLQWSAPGPR
jgi:hypothetical protein